MVLADLEDMDFTPKNIIYVPTKKSTLLKGG